MLWNFLSFFFLYKRLFLHLEISTSSSSGKYLEDMFVALVCDYYYFFEFIWVLHFREISLIRKLVTKFRNSYFDQWIYHSRRWINTVHRVISEGNQQRIGFLSLCSELGIIISFFLKVKSYRRHFLDQRLNEFIYWRPMFSPLTEGNASWCSGNSWLYDR